MQYTWKNSVFEKFHNRACLYSLLFQVWIKFLGILKNTLHFLTLYWAKDAGKFYSFLFPSMKSCKKDIHHLSVIDDYYLLLKKLKTKWSIENIFWSVSKYFDIDYQEINY